MTYKETVSTELDATPPSSRAGFPSSPRAPHSPPTTPDEGGLLPLPRRVRRGRDVKTGHADNADGAYNAATEAAKSSRADVHPIRLGLALNYSVFYYEVQGNPEEAKQDRPPGVRRRDRRARHARRGQSYKDSTLIMQLLRDNLTLWTSDDGADN